MKVLNKKQINKENLTLNLELVVSSVDCIGCKTTVSKGLSEKGGKVVYLKCEYIDHKFEDVKEYNTLKELKGSIYKIEHY